MKKRRVILATLVCALILTVVYLTASGKKPFRNLDASAITAASVRLTPPDQTVVVPDLEELTQYLRGIVIYGEDDTYSQYCGQGVVFTLALADGTQIEVMAYNPFVVIDGTGYRAKYKPCEALASYANGLLESGDAQLLWKQPPALSVSCGDTNLGALLGTYSWQYKNEDDTATGIHADGLHPLDENSRELMQQMQTSEAVALLRFQDNPDHLVVRCWNAGDWGDTTAQSHELSVDGGMLTLRQGAWIYEVVAEWTSDEHYSGTAAYSFYLDAGENFD